MDLGTLLLTINLSTDELYRGLDRAKTQVAAAGREMETTLNRRVDSINQSLKLVTQVDDTALTNLNKHLDLKVKHVQQVNRYLKSNPVTPTSDTSDIDQAFLKLNQFRKAYQEVNAYVRNNPIVIGTDNGGIDESVGRLNEIPKAVSKINQRLKSNPVKLSTNTIELDQTEQKLNRYEHRIKSLRRTSIAVGVKDSIPLAARTAADSATAAKNLSEGKPFYAAAEAYKQANAKTPQSKIIVKAGNPTGGAIATVLVDRTLGPIIEQAVKTGMQVGSQYLSDKLKSHPIAKTLGLDKAFADIAKAKQTEQLKSAAPPPQTPERREKSATPQPVKVVQQDNRQRSNLLGTPLRFLSAPARQTLGGFYSGIGYAYGSRFGEGSLEGLQKRTGLDLKKAGSNAVGATGYLAGVGNLELLVKSIGNIQDIENTVQPVLKKYGLGQDQRFNVNKAADAAFGSVKGGLGAVVPILDKSLDADRIQTDIADTKEALAELTLALVKLDNVAGKAKNLRDLTGKMAKYPSEAVIATYKKSARESARNLEQRLQEPAAPAQPLPEGTRKVALVSGGFAAAGGKSGHKVAASLSPFMAEGTHVVPFENREFDVAKDAATDGFVAWAADVVQQVAKVLDKGYNPASVRMATEALAYKKANPDVELDLIGYSAGGLIAREAQEILKELQVEANVLTLGTPNVGAFASVSERSASVFGAGDPLKYLSANRLKDLEGVKGHGFDMYETDKQLQSIIQRFSSEGVTPELVEELRALQKTTQEQVAQTRAANTQVKAQQQKAATTKQPVTVSQPTQITGDPQQLALKARALMLSQQARNILPGFDPKAYGKSASAAATNQKQAEQALTDLAKLDLSTELSVEHVNTLRQAITRLTALANRVGETAVPALDELSKLPVEELQRLVSVNMASDQAQQVGQLQQYLQTFTRKDLQTIAKQSGATGYSKLNKSDLVNLLAKNVNTSSQLAKEQDALKQIRKAEESLIALSRKAKATTDPAKQEQMNVELRASVLSLIDKVNDALQVTQHGENRQYIGGVKGRLEQQYLRSFNMSESSIEQMRKRLQQGQGQPQGSEVRSGVDDIGLARILPGVKQAYQPDSIGFVKNTIDGIKGLFSKAKGSLNEALNIQSGAGVRANLRNVAKSPLANDLVVNTAGFAASRAAAHYGVVPELGADLTAALATRQALNAGRAVAGSYSALKKDDAFQAANALQKFTMVVIASTQRFQSAGFQKRMGEELTGDLTGFTIGNVAAMAANAVPAFAPVPFKGAAAAMATVPKLVQMRDRHLKGDSDESKLDETGLARILPKVPIPAASKSFISAARSALNGMKGLSKIFNDTQSIAQRRYEEIAKETAKLSGVKLDDRNMPKMVVDSKRLKEMGVGAFYDIQKNQVIISKEVENILKDAQNLEDFSEEIKAVVHELRHSLQLKGGKLSLSKIAKGRQQFGVSMTDPGSASLEAIENADKSVEAIRREALKRNGYRITGAEERTIRQAEIDAYQFEQNTPQIAQSVQQALDSEMQAKMQATAKSMIDSVDEIAQAFEQVFPGLGRYTQVFGQRLSSLGSIAGSVVTTFVSFKVLQGLIGLFRTISNGALEAARSMEKFAITIEFSKGGQAKGVEGLAFVREQVQAMGGDFQSAARGYTQVSAAARGTSLEGYEADQIFKAFEQAANVYQLDAPSKDRLFTAVQQIMSKETISSEELKQQIGEVLPGFMQTVARSRGETVSEVTRALQGGELTSTKDLPKIAQQLTAETSGGLTKSLESSQAAVNRFNTAMYEFKALMGKPLVEAEKLGLNALSGVLGSVGEHVDFVVKAFAILSGMAFVKLLQSVAGLTTALYGFLVQLGLLPPLALTARTALVALKGALIEISSTFALIYVGITVAQAAFEIFSDRSGELGKNARASTEGLNALAESLNKAAEAGQKLNEINPKKLKATGLVGDIAEANKESEMSTYLGTNWLELLNQYLVDKQRKAYEDSVKLSSDNVKQIIQSADNFTTGASGDSLENLSQIDRQIEENQTRQRTLRIQDPGNVDELKRLQQEAENLNIERGQYANESGLLQQELQATLDRRKQDLETLNGLLENNNISQEDYNRLTKQTSADIRAIEDAQTRLNQKISQGAQKLAEFNKNIKQIAAELADAKENAEINVNLRRTEAARSELARGYTPGQSQAVGDQINIKGLQEQINATTAAISRYESQIANSNAGRTLELMGIEDPTSLGTAQIQNLKELYQGNAQETAALDAIEKLRQARIDTTGLTAQLAEAQVQAQRSITEATRQVADFYRQTMRGVEEFQRSIESLNLSQQVTEAKLELQRNISGFTGRFFGFLGDTLSGLLEQLYEPERIMLDAQGQVAGLQAQLQDNRLNAVQTERGLYGSNGGAGLGSVEGQRVAELAIGREGVDFRAGVAEQCANFVRDVFKQAGIDLGVTNAPVDGLSTGEALANSFFGEDIGVIIRNPEDLQPGDIVGYANTYGNWEPGTITHAAVYAGNGMIVDRSTSAGDVNYRPLDTFDTANMVAVRPHALVGQPAMGQSIGGGLQTTSAPSTGVDINRLREAIAGQESGGDYGAVNPHSGALGRYQVMPENVPYWSEKFLGQSMSPDAFLADPQLQDQLVNAVMGDMLERALGASGGDSTTAIRRVAAEWYSGQPDLYNDTAPQSYGAGSYPSIAEYTTSIAERYGAQPATSGSGQMATVNTAPISQSSAAYQQVGGQYGSALVSEAASRSELAQVNIARSLEKFQQQLEQGGDQLSDTRIQRQRQLEDVLMQPLQNTQFGQQYSQSQGALRQMQDQRTESQRLVRDTERDLAAIEAALETARVEPKLQDLVAPLTESLERTKEALGEFQAQADQYDAAYSQAQAAVDRQNRRAQERERQGIEFQGSQLQGRLDIQGVRDSGIQSLLQSPLDVSQIYRSYEEQTRQIQDDIQVIYNQIEEAQKKAAEEGLPLNSDFVEKANAEVERLQSNLEAIRDNRDIEVNIRVLQNEQALNDYFYQLQSGRVDAQARAMEGRGDIYGAAELRQSDAELTENRRYSDQMSGIDALAATGQYDPIYIARIREEAELLTQVNLENIDRQFMDLGETLSQVGQNALGGFLEDLLTGKNALESLKSALSGLASQLAQMAVQQLFAGIFGGGGGGLGGLFGGAPTMAPAGGGGGLTTALGIAQTAMSFFGGGGGMGGLMGFKEGGVVGNASDFADLRQGDDAIGKALRREGHNSVLATLTEGEMVLTVGQARRFHEMGLDKAIQGYKDGGVVGGKKFATPQMQMPSSGGNININVPVTVESNKQGDNDRINQHKLQDGIRSAVLQEIIRQKNPGGALYK